MRPLFTLLLAALAFLATAQPQKIHYQGVAVGANGKPIKNSTVGLRLSVLDSLPTGTTLYTETQTASTDAAGQFSIFLGGGMATAGTFANLPWANGNDKFLKVEMDAQGGNNFQPMGTTQLVSVPYAMAAGTAMVIDEGTLLRMKNGHIYRLDYPLNGQGPVWNAIGGVTQATISQDTIYTCSDSIWIFGNKVKTHEFSQWQVLSPFSLNQNLNSPEHDSLQVFRNWGDTLIFQYIINPLGNGGTTTDKVVVIFSSQFTKANAGADIQIINDSTAKLGANFPKAGEIGTWSILSGNGGILDSISNPLATFTKGPDSIYSLIWTISGPCGMNNDTLEISFPTFIVNIPCPSFPALTFEGETYPTVQIGSQCWMAKSLNVGAMVQGANDQINNGILEKYCYNNDTSNCTTYGGLYQWAEAVQYQNGASNNSNILTSFLGYVKGICPTEWHLPNDVEWVALEAYLGGTSMAGGALKSTQGFWSSPNSGATNKSGFSALPGGYRYGTFGYMTNAAFFWSSTETSSSNAITRNVSDSYSGIIRNLYNKDIGFSVRCIKDTCKTTSAAAGPDQLYLTGTTVSLSANHPKAGEIGYWTIIGNSPGTIDSAFSSNSRFVRGGDSAYSLLWTISGPCGQTYDTLHLLFSNLLNVTCGQSFLYQGESYPTIQIGNQCWMKKNLNVGSMINSISAVDSQKNNGMIEKYCFENLQANCDTFGGLYQWAEAVQYQNAASNTDTMRVPLPSPIMGICPNGWHIPKNEEWMELIRYLGDSLVAGGKMKSTSILWNAPNLGATDSSGYSALPSGFRTPNGIFTNKRLNSNFWASSENSSSSSHGFGLNNQNENISNVLNSKEMAISIRCIQDACIPTKAKAKEVQLPRQNFGLYIYGGCCAAVEGITPGLSETSQWEIIPTGYNTLAPPLFEFGNVFSRGFDNSSTFNLVYSINGPCGITKDTLQLHFTPLVLNGTCPGGTTVNYGGEVYPTVLIGGQCWMAKNLNIGTMVSSFSAADSQRNNGIIEKYCFNNDTAECNASGGLYQWDEAMQYGNKDICPTGWHVAREWEWMALESYLGYSFYGCAFADRIGGTGFGSGNGKYRVNNGQFNDDNWLNFYFWDFNEYCLGPPPTNADALPVRCLKD